MNAPRPKTQQVAFRLEKKLLRRIEAYRRRWVKKAKLPFWANHLWLNPTKADAVRMLLVNALDADERAEEGKRFE